MPAMIVLDDCQWADELTLKLMASWSNRPDGGAARRVVLVVAFRSEDVEALGREAHRFKGEASTLGASGVAELCVELEQMQAPLDRVAAGQLLSRADQEMQRALHDLHVELGTAQVS